MWPGDVCLFLLVEVVSEFLGLGFAEKELFENGSEVSVSNGLDSSTCTNGLEGPNGFSSSSA